MPVAGAPIAPCWQSSGFESLFHEFNAKAHALAVSWDTRISDLKVENERLQAIIKAGIVEDETVPTPKGFGRLKPAELLTTRLHGHNGQRPVVSPEEAEAIAKATEEARHRFQPDEEAAKVETDVKVVGNDNIGLPSDLQQIQMQDKDQSPSPRVSKTTRSECTAVTMTNTKSVGVRQIRTAMQEIAGNPHLTAKESTTTSKKSGRITFHAFSDIEELKEQVRHAILQPYHVSQFYYESGFFSRIAKTPFFEEFTFVIVALNSIWIAIDVDINGAKTLNDKDAIYQAIEYSFVLYFCCEILIRFAAFRRKVDCIKDSWVCFDAILALLMCVDTMMPYFVKRGLGFNTSLIRLARLIKISRMARIAAMLKRWPEMNVLLQGIGIGLRSSAAAALLLIVVVYVFAVALRVLTVDTSVGEKYFRSVLFGMKTLSLYAAMPDAINVVDDTGDEAFLTGLCVVLFISLTSLTLLNMLIGVLCEVISVVSRMEKEKVRIQAVEGHLKKVLNTNGVDLNHDGFISKHEFQAMLMNKVVVQALRTCGVDPVGLLDFIDYIFGSCGTAAQGLTFDKLVELICQLGGSNKATVKDIIDMRQVMIRYLAKIEDALHHIQSASPAIPSVQPSDHAKLGPTSGPCSPASRAWQPCTSPLLIQDPQSTFSKFTM